MVRIIDLDQDYPYEGRNAAFSWWKGTTVHCEQFFKAISHFDPQCINAEYLIKLQMSYIQFERSPYPQSVTRARDILLNSMFAAISATSTALAGDDDKSRLNMNAALTNLQRLKQELLTLGIRVL